MSRSPRRPPADAAVEPRDRAVPGLAAVVVATLAVLVTAADTYVVVLALPDILTGVGVGLDELQRATPIIGGFLLGLHRDAAAARSAGRPARPDPGADRLPAAVRVRLAADRDRGRPWARPSPGGGCRASARAGWCPATLALVADRWPPERRALPLGVVGAVQEAGAVLGPLAGAAVLAVADWRAIFWLNLLLGVGLAAGVLGLGPRTAPGSVRPGPGRRSPSSRSGCSWPRRRAGRGRHARPALRAAGRRGRGHDAAGAGDRRRRRRRWWPAASPSRGGAVLPLRGLRRLVCEVDVLGSALVVVARWAAWCGPSPPPTRPPRSSPTAGAPAGGAGRRRGVRVARAAHARPGAAAAGAAAAGRLGGAAGQPARRGRPRRGPGRRPAVRPQHHDARRPVRRRPGAAAAARRGAGRRGRRRVAVPRSRPGSSRPAAWRWPAARSSS